MKGRWSFLFSTLILFFSISEARAQSARLTNWGTIRMDVGVWVKRDGAPRPARQYELLYNGDLLELMVKVECNAYLYVVQFYMDGSSEILFPPTGEEFIAKAGQQVRIPKKGQWLQIDEAVGRETFYVIVSDVALKKADHAVARMLGRGSRARAVALTELKPNMVQAQATMSSLSSLVAMPPDYGWREADGDEVRMNDEGEFYVNDVIHNVGIFSFSYRHERRP